MLDWSDQKAWRTIVKILELAIRCVDSIARVVGWIPSVDKRFDLENEGNGGLVECCCVRIIVMYS
jgi:hypothetical protein